MDQRADTSNLVEFVRTSLHVQLAPRATGLAPPPLRRVVEWVALAALVWAASQVGLWVQFDGMLSPLWPPHAVLFAVLLLVPADRVPWYALAALPAKAYLMKGGGLPAAAMVTMLAATYAQLVIPAYLIRRLTKPSAVLSSVAGTVAFIAIGALLGPLLKAVAAALTISLAKPNVGFWPLGRDWFMSELIAFLVLVPPILLLFGERWHARLRPRVAWSWRVAEAVAVWALVLASSVVAFHHADAAGDHTAATLFLPLPFLLWAAVRQCMAGASAGLLTLAAVALEHGMRHAGPFGNGAAHNALALQVFIAMSAVPLLLLAAFVKERAGTAANLRESERRFRDLFELLPIGVAVLGPDSESRLCNKRAAEVLGLAHEEATSHSPLDPAWDIIHDDGTPYASADLPVPAAIASRRPVIGAMLGVRNASSGDRVWVRVNTVPRLAEDGSVREVLCAFHDVTLQKAATEALRESEQRYRDLVETQTELVCRYLPDATLTFVNEAYCRFFGRTRDELVGHKFTDFIPPTARDSAAEVIAQVVRDGKPIPCEHEVIGAGGAKAWQHWIDHPIFDVHGRVVELQGIGRDVTERRKTDEALRASLAEVQSLRERLEAENTYLHEELAQASNSEEIVCRSDAMRAALQHANRVAPTSTTVLLHGETGTGKEVLAREIHRLSQRNDRPLIRVNCASLPTNLIESELFGHERGAFTGAAARRVGRFEVADRGTLLLDEIGELPLDLQAKLLRVLQEGEFERLGSSKTFKVDVRVIAATNRDLAAAVREGAFRADLYYRLNVFPIFVPPLRDRREEIIPLATKFLAAAGKRLGRVFDPLTRATADALLSHEDRKSVV